MADFNKALNYVLLDEGGDVDHPRDPGGHTNMGITQATYDTFRAASGKASRSVSQILPREVEIIYRVNFWTRTRAEEMPDAWGYAVFDYAVMSGTSTAIKVLQEVLGLKVDGIVGNKTLGATRTAGPEQLSAYLDARLARYKRLPTWGTFGHGWSNRLAKVRARIL